MPKMITDHCYCVDDSYYEGFYRVRFKIHGNLSFPDLEMESLELLTYDEAITWCRELESRLFLHETYL